MTSEPLSFHSSRTEVPVPAAQSALAGAVVVAMIIVALHFIKPELEPSWRFISEYSTGAHGWIMRVTFVLWAASCAALAAAIRPLAVTHRARIGVGILFLVAAAQVVAGLFPQDPVTARPHELTTAGNIHAAATMVGIPGIPLAAILITGTLRRQRRDRVAMTVAAHATWVSLALMILYLAWAVPRAGGFNSQVWAGAMNRLVVATYLMWQAVVARRVVAS